jgi:cytochrome b561
MQLRNTHRRFGLVALSFHWLVAALFVAMIAIGLTMTALALTHPWKFPLYQFHKSLGVTIFALVALRLLWRVSGPVPPLPVSLPAWERGAAHLTHWALYALLIVMPLTGWVIVSASPLGIPTVLYGIVRLPHIGFVAERPDKEAIEHVAATVHAVLAWTGIALVALHAGAALRHHFWLKDDVLRRMLPARALFSRKDGQTP